MSARENQPKSPPDPNNLGRNAVLINRYRCFTTVVEDPKAKLMTFKLGVNKWYITIKGL